jgi:hypothetical protein
MVVKQSKLPSEFSYNEKSYEGSLSRPIPQRGRRDARERESPLGRQGYKGVTDREEQHQSSSSHVSVGAH